MTVGYSGTPLWKKLSLKPGLRTWWENMPGTVRAEIEQGNFTLTHLPTPAAPIDAGHIFVTDGAVLEEAVHRLLPLLAPAGFLWISWPKKASKVPTDITEDRIRDIVLPLGLVDVKVCAIDTVWSGLKLMIRRDLRK